MKHIITPPLRRLGRKTKILEVLYSYFPNHDCYIEPFLGSGVVFLNKPQKANYNFLNDMDDNIVLCYDYLTCPQKAEALVDYIEMIPYSTTMWERIKLTKEFESDLQKVAYFLVLSAYGYLGKPDTLRLGTVNNKKTLLQQIKGIYKTLAGNSYQWANKDFRKLFASVSFKTEKGSGNTFCYNDPPYLNTTNNYNTPTWTEQDLRDLVRLNVENGWKFAISEFRHEVIESLVAEYNLNLHEISERQNLKSRQVEILVTNYKHHSLF
jgi:DNA adenine methylase